MGAVSFLYSTPALIGQGNCVACDRARACRPDADYRSLLYLHAGLTFDSLWPTLMHTTAE